MEKRYQVFVSSTFQDLQHERQEVMQALLELDCIPAGMELFPAGNQDQWTLIKKVIDDCDYYIVISAGRYGSAGPDGIGYTELEYRYAIERAKPIIGFLYRDPTDLLASRVEPTDGGKAKLAEFRKLIEGKVVRYWESPAELGSQVSRSIVKLIKTEPAIGWIKADALPSDDVTRELLRLRKRVEELEHELRAARFTAPAGSESLAQGSDVFGAVVIVPAVLESEFAADPEMGYEKLSYEIDLTWNGLFAAVAPLMIAEVSDPELRRGLLTFVHSQALTILDGDDSVRFYDSEIITWTLSDETFQTIKVQFRALGLIAQSNKPRSVKNTATYWTLTALGDETMTSLRAIRRTPDTNQPTSRETA